jgi:hypothetical protein
VKAIVVSISADGDLSKRFGEPREVQEFGEKIPGVSTNNATIKTPMRGFMRRIIFSEFLKVKGTVIQT